MKRVTVALDWTPNTNHTGFYVARAQGLYSGAGLDVRIISPHVDEYKRTPGSRLTDGSATFASVPSETVISYHTAPADAGMPPPKIVAVAALLQDSTSAIATLKSSGIDRPMKLDGKRYASYAARYEGRIVQCMIRNDGGKGEYVETTPPMLGIWNTLLQGEADATWIFQGWESIKAAQAGVELNCFKLEDYGITYGYSPVLATTPETLRDDPGAVRAFLAATAQGYGWAAAHPSSAARLLLQEVERDCTAVGGVPLPEPLEEKMVLQAQEFASKHYLSPSTGGWGAMDSGRWDAFLDWLSSSGLLTTKMQSRMAAGAATAAVGEAGGGLTSLDGLRAGDVGELIPRDSIQSAQLATNQFLPSA